MPDGSTFVRPATGWLEEAGPAWSRNARVRDRIPTPTAVPLSVY